MDIPVDDFVSGGYLITQFIDMDASYNQWLQTVAGAVEALFPDRVLSVGFCDAVHAPLFRWVGHREEDYARFGIAPDRIAPLTDWANERLDRQIGYPNLFFHLPTAREYIQRFTDQTADNQLLGIGLARERLPQIAASEQLRPATRAESGARLAGLADTGFAQALRLGEPPVPGEILGFDVICCDYNIEHSWLCNGLAVDGLEKFHFRPNRFGLIDDRTRADSVADYAATIPTEPGIWLPVLVTRYPPAA